MKLILDIEPKPQTRPRFSRRRGARVYEDDSMKAWRVACSLLVMSQYRGKALLDGALKTRVRFYIKPPVSLSRVKKNQENIKNECIPVGKKPDIDNYEKALYDSMSGIVFHDDGQIAFHEVGKFYSYRPRIEIEITEYEQDNGTTNH